MLHAVIAKYSTLFSEIAKGKNQIKFSSSSLSVKIFWAQNCCNILSIHGNVVKKFRVGNQCDRNLSLIYFYMNTDIIFA